VKKLYQLFFDSSQAWARGLLFEMTAQRPILPGMAAGYRQEQGIFAENMQSWQRC
jgi:hypothetical protein